MNNIASKLQNAGHRKFSSKSHENAKLTKILLQLAFYISKGRTCKVLPFYRFQFKFYDKFCIPFLIVEFLYIFNHQNRKP